jgi:S1-C subfamily serine protease
MAQPQMPQWPPAQYPGWQPPPPPPPPRRSGAGIVLLAAIVIFAAFALTFGRTLLQPSGAQPTVTGGPVGDTNTQPSGRKPGVVDIDTVLGYRNAEAAGTGIVIKSSGIVLTNNHVIAGATRIRVTDTDNGHTYKAKVLGYARSADIAVLQLQTTAKLKTAILGDSSKVAEGDVVTAVGNAGGKGGPPSVVTGSVTALDQAIVARDQSDGTSENLKGLIQTSAPIQPGDSGGPLLNTKGQVIGIDTAASAGFQFQRDAGRPGSGRGFAIPTNHAMPIVTQIENGAASATVHIGRTALLGVQVRSNTSGGGAQVADIFPGTPAESAGLQPGAELTTLDGSPIDSPTALTDMLLRHHPGDVVRLGWTDPGGGERSAAVRLADGPPQ